MNRRGPKIRLPKRRPTLEVPSNGDDWEHERAVEAQRKELFAKAKSSLAEWCHRESINDDACFALAQLVEYKASESAKLRVAAQLRQKAKKEKAPRVRKNKTKPVKVNPFDISFKTSGVPDGWRELKDDEKKAQWIDGARYYSASASKWRFNPAQRTRNRLGAHAVKCDRIIVPIT